jgi:hypothetical protein
MDTTTIILIFIISLLILSIYFTINYKNKEKFTIFPWNIPTRLNNYIYDIRGYPNLFMCYNKYYNYLGPCSYLFNHKYDVQGDYIYDPLYYENIKNKNDDNIVLV